MAASRSLVPSSTRVQATWNGAVIADSDQTIVVEGNHYFPPDSIRRELFQPSDTHSHCPWKGDASYYSVATGGQTNTDAAWYYPEPYAEASGIKDYVAFWNGVAVGPI